MLSFAAAVVYYLTYVVDLALYSTLFYSYFQYFAESVFTGAWLFMCRFGGRWGD